MRESILRKNRDAYCVIGNGEEGNIRMMGWMTKRKKKNKTTAYKTNLVIINKYKPISSRLQIKISTTELSEAITNIILNHDTMFIASTYLFLLCVQHVFVFEIK